MSRRVGSLCTGYGGLEQGLADLFDVDLAWVSDIDKGANKILAHRYPDTPNLGDFTTVDWRQVEPVDVLCAGFPCQPVSHAGKRAGTDDERWLFDDICNAIGDMGSRPRLLVFENVVGLLSANERRAMERVIVSGLAPLGYVGRYGVLRAADVGAPHGRARVFIVAQDADRATRGEWRVAASRQAQGGRSWADVGGRGRAPDLLPTPRATRGGSATETVELLPTPTAQAAKHSADDRGPGSLDDFNLWSIAARLLPTPTTQPTTGNGHARNLGAETRLLPTPTVSDHPDARRSTRDGATYSADGYTRELLGDVVAQDRWGDYAPAIARWETTIGRPAPAPTETGPKGSPRLSPRFVEFMMGLPAGWVTDVPGLTRNEQLKALGNGVVPQQAAAAVGWLLDQITRRGAA